MMRTRTIATGAGITGSADCPQAFRRRVVSSAGPLALCGLLPRRRPLVEYFPRGTFGDLGAFGNGAPPHARIHLNIEMYPSGSPQTKFGLFRNGL